MSKHKQRPDAALWDAVDQLTKTAMRRLDRDSNHQEAVEDTVAALRNQDRGGRLVPADLGRYAAMTSTHTRTPNLWDQAEEALAASTADQDEGGGGSVHRSLFDIELMEHLRLIRKTLAVNLGVRRLDRSGTVPEQMRRIAAHIAGHEPGNLAQWAARFDGWARLLSHHLRAEQAPPKPRRIRGVACPECQVTSVVLELATGEQVSVPPIVIDFQDGQVRAAECSGCHAVLAWRGEQMWRLADRINATP